MLRNRGGSCGWTEGDFGDYWILWLPCSYLDNITTHTHDRNCTRECYNGGTEQKIICATAQSLNHIFAPGFEVNGDAIDVVPLLWWRCLDNITANM